MIIVNQIDVGFDLCDYGDRRDGKKCIYFVLFVWRDFLVYKMKMFSSRKEFIVIFVGRELVRLWVIIKNRNNENVLICGSDDF